MKLQDLKIGYPYYACDTISNYIAKEETYIRKITEDEKTDFIQLHLSHNNNGVISPTGFIEALKNDNFYTTKEEYNTGIPPTKKQLFFYRMKYYIYKFLTDLFPDI